MLSPQGGKEKLGSQILLLIDTWVNIILAEGEGKKRSMLVFLSRSRDGQGEKLKTQFCDIDADAHLQGGARPEVVRAGPGWQSYWICTREPRPWLLCLITLTDRFKGAAFPWQGKGTSFDGNHRSKRLK